MDLFKDLERNIEHRFNNYIVSISDIKIIDFDEQDTGEEENYIYEDYKMGAYICVLKTGWNGFFVNFTLKQEERLIPSFNDGSEAYKFERHLLHYIDKKKLKDKLDDKLYKKTVKSRSRKI